MHTRRLTPISCDTYLRGSENKFIRVFFQGRQPPVARKHESGVNRRQWDTYPLS